MLMAARYICPEKLANVFIFIDMRQVCLTIQRAI
jgi:hypothetical protein